MMSFLARRSRLLIAVVAMLGILIISACTGAPQGSPADKKSGTTAQEPTTTSPAPKEAAVTMQPPNGATGVNPLTPVVLTVANGTISDVVMANQEGAPVQGTLSADGLSWTSAEPLGYSKTYTITANTMSVDGVASSFNGEVQTVVPANQTKAYTVPGKAGNTYGVGMPVIVRFDEPIPDKNVAEQFMTVTTNPPVEGHWYWFSNKVAHWRPKDFYAPGTSVSLDVKIYGQDLGGGLYGETDTHTDFVVGDSVISEVNQNDLQMRVYKNGALIKTMPASLGEPKYPSQNGIHVVQEKYEMKIMDSSTWGLPTDHPDGYYTEVPYATRISQSGEFVHSAPWSELDQGIRNVSHGCVNLSMENGKWFYNNSKFGDIVIITGTPVDLKWGDGYADWNVPWETWKAGNK